MIWLYLELGPQMKNSLKNFSSSRDFLWLKKKTAFEFLFSKKKKKKVTSLWLKTETVPKIS